MDQKTRTAILRTGGKKALKKYNAERRVPLSEISTSTKVIEDGRHRAVKHRKRMMELCMD